jgi:hypothetical protein
MYTPHQVPWTISGTEGYLAEMTRRVAPGAYVTVDTGHQTGQHRFLRPERAEIERALRDDAAEPWLGSDGAFHIFREARGSGAAAANEAAARIDAEMDRFPHLFAAREDCDLYRWLERVGCYSPIVHLQQTGGDASSHLPFTKAANAAGIVHPEKLLTAIARSYDAQERPDLPPRVEKIYLTFEIFTRTTDTRRDILPALEESVRYWRRWVPVDGVELGSMLPAFSP